MKTKLKTGDYVKLLKNPYDYDFESVGKVIMIKKDFYVINMNDKIGQSHNLAFYEKEIKLAIIEAD
jgi:hypothetical protein